MPRPLILKTASDIRVGVRALSKRCPRMQALHDLSGVPALRRRPAGFRGLARIITEQQLSTASAAAIWQRVEALADPFTANAVLALDRTALKNAGLSAPKIRTLLILAEHIDDGRLNLKALAPVKPNTVSTRLTTLPGIGPWTADIYAMFCLGFADAFAPGDLALQISAQHTFAFKTRPSSRQLSELAEQWRPWRSVAARLLWSSDTKLRNGAEIGL